jgi:hypothetical protein
VGAGEAKTISQLSHPQIGALYDMVSTAGSLTPRFSRLNWKMEQKT